MEENVSTTVETSEEQTTPEVVETSQPDDAQTTENATKESEETEVETTETGAQEQPKEQPKDWEKIAKDNQASFTKVSQELAELKKQVEQSKPRLVEQGKINPQFEQKYKFEVDNREFLAYDNLARQLEPETRAVVENLLGEARRLYNPNNKRAYEAKMATIKDYFRSDLVEQIANEKYNLNSRMQAEFQKAIQADKLERANRVAQAVDGVPELKGLLEPDSENFSPEVFDIVQTMFDYTGDVDIQATTKAISKIKELGVKEYLAKQSAQKAASNANVPEGNTVLQTSSGISAEEASKNYEKYLAKFQKQGLSFKDAMAKVDNIIMKG